MIVFPIAAKTGRAFSRTVASPPTIIASVPSTAPGSPPLTGASRKEQPCSAASSANSFDSTGVTELISAIIVPFAAPASTPSAPLRMLRTIGPLGTIVMTISAPTAASFAECAAAAPSAVIRFTASVTTSKTVTEKPALSRLCTMGFPIMPSPINPMFFIFYSSHL